MYQKLGTEDVFITAIPYQLLSIILCQILFLPIYQIYMICKHFVDNILNVHRLILLYPVKWFQVFLSYTNNSIYN